MQVAGPSATVLDAIEALLISLVLMVISPLKSLRSLSELGKVFLVAKVLCRLGVMASTLRATVDLRTGREARAIGLIESVAAVVEDEHFRQKRDDSEAVLGWLFGWIAALYLQLAQIDDAAITVIRANKSIGISKLPSVPELDVKTAHIVKAGLAAGKLLDENGAATFMVQAGELSDTQRKSKKRDAKSKSSGKIIPFPVPQKT